MAKKEAIMRDMKAMPDSWRQVNCTDGSIEDVIFIEGMRFLTYEDALEFVTVQFLESNNKYGLRAAVIQARDYLSLISVVNNGR